MKVVQFIDKCINFATDSFKNLFDDEELKTN